MQIFLKTLSVKQHALPGKSRDLLRKANFFFLTATEEVHYKNLKPVAATLINHDKDIIKYTEQSGWCLEMNNKMKTGLWLSKISWKTLWAELHFYHSVMNFLQTGSTQFEWCLMCSCIYSHPDYDSKKKRKKHTICDWAKFPKLFQCTHLLFPSAPKLWGTLRANFSEASQSAWRRELGRWWIKNTVGVVKHFVF